MRTGFQDSVRVLPFLDRSLRGFDAATAGARDRLERLWQRVPASSVQGTQLEFLGEDLKSRSFREIRGACSSQTLDGEDWPLAKRLLDFIQGPVFEEAALSTEEEDRLLGALQDKQGAWVPVERDELLRLVIHDEGLSGGLSVPIFVVKSHELSDVIGRMKASQVPQRKAIFIVRHGVHYTCVFFQKDQEASRMTVLDAAQDERMRDWLSKINLGSTERVFIGENEADTLQKDGRSCSIFALDHAIQLSREPSLLGGVNPKIYPTREDLGGAAAVPWAALPKCLSRLSQKQPEGDAIVHATLAEWHNRVINKLNALADRRCELLEVACRHPQEEIENLNLH